MDYEELKEYLRTFHHAFRVPVSLVSEETICISYTPIALEEDLCMKEMKMHLKKERRMMYLEKDTLLYGYIWIDGIEMFLLTGPVRSVKGTSRQYERLEQSWGLSIPLKRKIKYFLERTPVMNHGRFLAMLRFLDYSVNGKKNAEQPEDAGAKDVYLSDGDFVQMSEAVAEPEATHNTEWLEKEILHLIEAGNREQLTEKLMEIPMMEIDSACLAEDEVKNIQVVYIICVTLCARAAVRGGLSYEYAMEMSDRYIRELGQKDTVEQLTPKLGHMMVDFCEKVQQLKKPQNVQPLTLEILGDIQANLYGRLRIADIAGRIGKSGSYLSHTFTKDMGQDLQSYIRQQKIEEAKRLLEYDEKNILQIAELLGYSSQAHFQRVFKQETGKTPLEYRKEHP